MNLLVVEKDMNTLERVEQVFGSAGLGEGLIALDSIEQALDVLDQVRVEALFFFLSPEQLNDKGLHRKVLTICDARQIACVSNLNPDDSLRAEVVGKGHLFLDRTMTIDELLDEIRFFLGVESSGNVVVQQDIYSLGLSVFDISLLDGIASGYSDEVLISIACMGQRKINSRIKELMDLFEVETREELVRKYRLLER